MVMVMVMVMGMGMGMVMEDGDGDGDGDGNGNGDGDGDGDGDNTDCSENASAPVHKRVCRRSYENSRGELSSHGRTSTSNERSCDEQLVRET